MSLQHAGTSWQHTPEPQQAEHALWAPLFMQQAHQFHFPADKPKGCAFGVGLWCDCSLLSTHLACLCFPFHKPWPVHCESHHLHGLWPQHCQLTSPVAPWCQGSVSLLPSIQILCVTSCPFLGEFLCHFMSFYVILCHFMSFYVILCHRFMSFYVILCHFMSVYVGAPNPIN